jgi:hypothetical protein
MKFKSILQVIFRGAYWLRFWAQLQRKEQAKDTLIAMSRKLESRCSTDCQWRTEHFLSFTLVGGMLPIAACFFTTFVERSFQLCNNWLCTSSDVEAGFNYPLSKKSVRACCERLRCNVYIFGDVTLFKGKVLQQMLR